MEAKHVALHVRELKPLLGAKPPPEVKEKQALSPPKAVGKALLQLPVSALAGATAAAPLAAVAAAKHPVAAAAVLGVGASTTLLATSMKLAGQAIDQCKPGNPATRVLDGASDTIMNVFSVLLETELAALNSANYSIRWPVKSVAADIALKTGVDIHTANALRGLAESVAALVWADAVGVAVAGTTLFNQLVRQTVRSLCQFAETPLRRPGAEPLDAGNNLIAMFATTIVSPILSVASNLEEGPGQPPVAVSAASLGGPISKTAAAGSATVGGAVYLKTVFDALYADKKKMEPMPAQTLAQVCEDVTKAVTTAKRALVSHKNLMTTSPFFIRYPDLLTWEGKLRYVQNVLRCVTTPAGLALISGLFLNALEDTGDDEGAKQAMMFFGFSASAGLAWYQTLANLVDLRSERGETEIEASSRSLGQEVMRAALEVATIGGVCLTSSAIFEQNGMSPPGAHEMAASCIAAAGITGLAHVAANSGWPGEVSLTRLQAATEVLDMGAGIAIGGLIGGPFGAAAGAGGVVLGKTLGALINQCRHTSREVVVHTGEAAEKLKGLKETQAAAAFAKQVDQLAAREKDMTPEQRAESRRLLVKAMSAQLNAVELRYADIESNVAHPILAKLHGHAQLMEQAIIAHVLAANARTEATNAWNAAQEAKKRADEGGDGGDLAGLSLAALDAAAQANKLETQAQVAARSAGMTQEMVADRIGEPWVGAAVHAAQQAQQRLNVGEEHKH